MNVLIWIYYMLAKVRLSQIDESWVQYQTDHPDACSRAQLV